MTTFLSRRQLLATAGRAAAAALAIPLLPGEFAAAASMVVYKDPGCGCCKSWVTIMQKAGFEVSAIDTPDMRSIKKRYGVSDALASCHTAVVGGYVVEGHVPADLVQRLLREKPKVKGLAVPGMPMGSPGMEVGGQKDPYEVLTFDAAGKTTVYAKR